MSPPGGRQPRPGSPTRPAQPRARRRLRRHLLTRVGGWLTRPGEGCSSHRIGASSPAELSRHESENRDESDPGGNGEPPDRVDLRSGVRVGPAFAGWGGARPRRIPVERRARCCERRPRAHRDGCTVRRWRSGMVGRPPSDLRRRPLRTTSRRVGPTHLGSGAPDHLQRLLRGHDPIDVLLSPRVSPGRRVAAPRRDHPWRGRGRGRRAHRRCRIRCRGGCHRLRNSGFDLPVSDDIHRQRDGTRRILDTCRSGLRLARVSGQLHRART